MQLLATSQRDCQTAILQIYTHFIAQTLTDIRHPTENKKNGKTLRLDRRLGEGKGKCKGLPWPHLFSLGPAWSHLISLGLAWYQMVSRGLTRVLVSHGITWSHVLSHGLTWSHMVSLGFTWLHLPSLELTRLHLASLGFTWSRLVSHWSHLNPPQLT